MKRQRLLWVRWLKQGRVRKVISGMPPYMQNFWTNCKIHRQFIVFPSCLGGMSMMQFHHIFCVLPLKINGMSTIFCISLLLLAWAWNTWGITVLFLGFLFYKVLGGRWGPRWIWLAKDFYKSSVFLRRWQFKNTIKQDSAMKASLMQMAPHGKFCFVWGMDKRWMHHNTTMQIVYLMYIYAILQWKYESLHHGVTPD